MSDADEQSVVLPEERFEIRLFGLADHAEAINENGKLYINGFGVSSIYTNRMPSALPPLFIVVRLHVPWQKMTEPFPLRIRALNADRTPVARDPLLEITPEVGRPPGYRVGDEACINLTLGIGGMPLATFGTMYIHLEVDGQTLATHPLKIIQLPAQTLGGAPQ